MSTNVHLDESKSAVPADRTALLHDSSAAASQAPASVQFNSFSVTYKPPIPQRPQPSTPVLPAMHRLPAASLAASPGRSQATASSVTEPSLRVTKALDAAPLDPLDDGNPQALGDVFSLITGNSNPGPNSNDSTNSNETVGSAPLSLGRLSPAPFLSGLPAPLSTVLSADITQEHRTTMSSHTASQPPTASVEDDLPPAPMPPAPTANVPKPLFLVSRLLLSQISCLINTIHAHS